MKTQFETGMHAARSVPLTPDAKLPSTLRIFAMRGAVAMPGASIPLRVGRPETVELVRAVGIGGLLVSLTLRRGDSTSLSASDFFSSRVLRSHRLDSID